MTTGGAVPVARRQLTAEPAKLIVVTGSDIARIAVAALAFATIAALIPARYTARLDPATAFRR